jgi:hypothetical protein
VEVEAGGDISVENVRTVQLLFRNAHRNNTNTMQAGKVAKNCRNKE